MGALADAYQLQTQAVQPAPSAPPSSSSVSPQGLVTGLALGPVNAVTAQYAMNQHSGGWLGGLIGNLYRDVVSVPTGLYNLVGTAIGDVVRSPIGVIEEAATLGLAHTDVKVMTPSFVAKIPIDFVSNLKNYYLSPQIMSHLYEHPLQPVLDAATIAGGAGAVARFATATGTTAAAEGAALAGREAAATAGAAGAEAAATTGAEAGAGELARLGEQVAQIEAKNATVGAAASGSAVLPPAGGMAGAFGRAVAGQSEGIAAWMQRNAQLLADYRATALARADVPGALQSGEATREAAAVADSMGVIQAQGAPITGVMRDGLRSLGDLATEFKTAPAQMRKAMVLDILSPEPLAIADPMSGHTFNVEPGYNPFVRAVWSDPLRRRFLTETVPEWEQRVLKPLQEQAAAAESAGTVLEPGVQQQLAQAEASFARMQGEGAQLVSTSGRYTGGLYIKRQIEGSIARMVSHYSIQAMLQRKDVAYDLGGIARQLEQAGQLPTDVADRLHLTLEGLDTSQGLHFTPEDLGTMLEQKGWQTPEAAARDLVFQTGNYQALTPDETNSLLRMVKDGQIPIQGLWRYTPGEDVTSVPERTAFETKFRQTADASGLSPEHQDMLMMTYDSAARAIEQQGGPTMAETFGNMDMRFQEGWGPLGGKELRQELHQTLEQVLNERELARATPGRGRRPAPSEDVLPLYQAKTDAEFQQAVAEYRAANGNSPAARQQISRISRMRQQPGAVERALERSTYMDRSPEAIGNRVDAMLQPLEQEAFHRYGSASDRQVVQLALTHGVISDAEAAKLGVLDDAGVRRALAQFTTGDVDQLIARVQRGLNDHIPADMTPYTPEEAASITWERTREIVQDELNRVSKQIRDLPFNQRRKFAVYQQKLQAVIDQGDPAAWNDLKRTPFGKKLTQKIATELSSQELPMRIGSEIRGATLFGPDFKTLTRIFRTGDFTTYVHEFGHVLRRVLPEDMQAVLHDVYLAKAHPGQTWEDVARNEGELFQAAPKDPERFATYQDRYAKATERVRQLQYEMKQKYGDTYQPYMNKGETQKMDAALRAAEKPVEPMIKLLEKLDPTRDWRAGIGIPDIMRMKFSDVGAAGRLPEAIKANVEANMDGFDRLAADIAKPPDKIIAPAEADVQVMDALEEKVMRNQRGPVGDLVMPDNEIGLKLRDQGVYVTGVDQSKSLADTWADVPTELKPGTQVVFAGNNMNGDVGTVVMLDPTKDVQLGNEIMASKYEALASVDPTQYERMPIVYKYGDMKVAAEGNHRIYRARQAGEAKLKVLLVDGETKVSDLVSTEAPAAVERAAAVERWTKEFNKTQAEELAAAIDRNGGDYAMGQAVNDRAFMLFTDGKPTAAKKALWNKLTPKARGEFFDRAAADLQPSEAAGITSHLTTAEEAAAQDAFAAKLAAAEPPPAPHEPLGAAGPAAQAETLAKFDAGDLKVARRTPDGWVDTTSGEPIDTSQFQMNDVNTGQADVRQFERIGENAAAPVAAPGEVAAEVPPVAPPPATPPAPPGGMGPGWTRDMEEAFATDFEKWFYKGLKPDHPGILPAFRVIGQQLTDLWRQMRGQILDTGAVPEEAARVFDQYVGDVFSQMRAKGDQPVPEALYLGRRRTRTLDVRDAAQQWGDGRAVQQLPGNDGTINVQNIRERSVLAADTTVPALRQIFGKGVKTSLKDVKAITENLDAGVSVKDGIRSRVIIPSWDQADNYLQQLSTKFEVLGVEDTRGVAGVGGQTGFKAYVVDPNHPDIVQEVEFATPLGDTHRDALYAHDRALNTIERDYVKEEQAITRLQMSDNPNQAGIMQALEEHQKALADLEIQRDAGRRYMEGYYEMLRDEVAKDFGAAIPRTPFRQAMEQFRLFVAKHSERQMFATGYADFQRLFERAYLPLRIKSAPDENVIDIMEGKSAQAKSAYTLDSERAAAGLPQPLYFPHMMEQDKFAYISPSIGKPGARKLAQNPNLRGTTGSLFAEGNYITDPFQVYSVRAARAIRMQDTFAKVQEITQAYGRKISHPNQIQQGEYLFAPDFASAFYRATVGVDDRLSALVTKVDDPQLLSAWKELSAQMGRPLAATDVITEGLAKSLSLSDKEAAGLYQAVLEAIPKSQRELIGVTRRGLDLYAVPEHVMQELEHQTKRMGVNNFTVAWDSYTHLWRSLALYGSPRWILNNFIGNISMAALEGVKLREVLAAATDRTDRWYTHALADMTGRGGEIDRGWFGGADLYPAELAGRGAETTVGQLERAALSKIRAAPIDVMKPFRAWKDFIKGFNTDMENLFREKGFLTGVRKDITGDYMDLPRMRNALRSAWSSKEDMQRMLIDGITPRNYDRGMNYMIKTFGDFSTLSPFERNFVRRYVAPFWGFYRHVGKMLIRAPFDHPFKSQLVAQLAREDEMMRAQYGPLPSYTDQMAPWGPIGPDGHVTFLSVAGPNPFNPFADLGLSVLHPIIQSGVEMMTGRDTFTGQEFTDPNVVTPYGSDQRFRIIRGPNGEPMDAVPVDKVTPSIGIELLNQFPFYPQAKALVAGGRPYDTEGLIGSINNPALNSQGQVTQPYGIGNFVGQQAGLNIKNYDIASYQARLEQERQAALSMAYKQWAGTQVSSP